MFEIFSPFKSVKKSDTVIITSWGAAGTQKMEQVIKNVSRAKQVKFLVGFGKDLHDLKLLKEVLMYYKNLGWLVHAAPSFHAKIWIIGKSAYIGSCNWFPDTVNNYMHKTNVNARIKNFVNPWWKKSYNITESTKLHLLT